MKKEIKVPSVGESVVEMTIGAIFKQNGSSVKVDEEILELETDKLNQAIYAPATGSLRLQIQSGATVKVGDVIGWVEEGAVSEPEASKPEVKEPIPTPSPPKTALPHQTSLPMKENEPPTLPSKAPFKPALPSFGPERRERMSRLRRVISERLVAVKNETAMLTTFNEVDMSGIIGYRTSHQEAFQKEHQVKLGFMSFFIKASLEALKLFPEMNARIDGDAIVYQEYYHMSIAVSTDQGLMVPVIRNVDQRAAFDLEKELLRLAEKARKGTISIEELQGGTFTITNGGQFGSLLSTPILNPPQSAILGMHNIVKRPVVVNDEIVIRPMMYLALSYDHRLIDGKTAVSFLVHIKKRLEELPESLLQ